MSPPRPFLRPAVVLERPALCVHADGGVALVRQALLAVASWRQLGFVCLAVDYQAHVANDVARVRAEITTQRQIEAALAGVGGGFHGTFVYPRPGESVDPDVPRASVFARLIMEATAQHRVDLPRSLFVAHGLDAVEGARIAGIPCGWIAAASDGRARELAARPSARPDYVWDDLAAVRVAVARQRERGAEA
ncbi:MAG: hypothetical protein R3F56_20830 [Planctomycetota bacterium]